MVLDTPDDLGVVYPSPVVLDAVREVENTIRESDIEGIFGEQSPPDYDHGAGIPSDYSVIDISRISHLVKHMWVENKTLMCKIKLMKEFVEMEKNDYPIAGLVRATGILDENNVCTSFSIITVDLVISEA